MKSNLGDREIKRQGLCEEQEPNEREEKPTKVGDDGDEGRPPDRRRLSHRRAPEVPPIWDNGDGRYDGNRASAPLNV